MAVLYTRVSTKRQAKEDRYSIPQQMEAVREYAAIEGDEVLEEIKDPVYSGASLKRTEELRDNYPIQSEWDGEGQAVVGGVYYRRAVRSPAPDLSRGG